MKPSFRGKTKHMISLIFSYNECLNIHTLVMNITGFKYRFKVQVQQKKQFSIQYFLYFIYELHTNCLITNSNHARNRTIFQIQVV